MSKLKHQIYKAAAQTFEELGFMIPMPDDDGQLFDEAEAVVCVRFEGPFRGRLLIEAYDGLLESLASNMLGEFEAVPLSQQIDALGEMANVICGNLLPEIAGKNQVFNLEPPAAVEAADGPEPHAQAEIVLDQGAANVKLYVEDASHILSENDVAAAAPQE